MKWRKQTTIITVNLLWHIFSTGCKLIKLLFSIQIFKAFKNGSRHVVKLAFILLKRVFVCVQTDIFPSKNKKKFFAHHRKVFCVVLITGRLLLVQHTLMWFHQLTSLWTNQLLFQVTFLIKDNQRTSNSKHQRILGLSTYKRQSVHQFEAGFYGPDRCVHLQ